MSEPTAGGSPETPRPDASDAEVERAIHRLSR